MQMGSLGLPELLVILLVVLLLFGPKRLPEVARGLGKAVHDFRRGLEHGLEEVTEATPSHEPGPAPDATVAAPPAPDAGSVTDPRAAEPVVAASRADGASPDAGPGDEPPARAA